MLQLGQLPEKFERDGNYPRAVILTLFCSLNSKQDVINAVEDGIDLNSPFINDQLPLL
jgi:hypothetical protein